MMSNVQLSPSGSTDTRPQRKYIFIVGHGRSGTKWIMNLLDACPQTFCRHEPDVIADSPLSALLHYRDIGRQDITLLEDIWDESISSILSHMGERDLGIKNSKEYLYDFPRRLGMMRLLLGPRYRIIMKRIMPTLSFGEWPMPWWFGSVNKLKGAIGVIKTVQTPGWATFVLQGRPEVPVVHIVRHPGGYINSWLNRYVPYSTPTEIAELNRRRLYDISDEDPEWKHRFGDIASMSMVKSELWYWRYATEIIHQCGNKSPNYHLVIYEDLAHEAVPIIKGIYKSAGLPWTDEIQSKIETECGDSLTIANNWKNKLPMEYQELVATILQDSPLNKFWHA